jgi:hypothetical protein
LSVTGVEWWDFALVALPKLITLAFGILRSRPVVFVGVVGVHVEGHNLMDVRLYYRRTIG